MSRTLFPALQGAGGAKAAQSLPLYREVAWDFKEDRPIFRGGNPVIAEGSAAVKVWAYHALQVPRYRHPHESFGYGCELERLRGQIYQAETKQAEAARYIKEALLVSPYIKEVSVSDVTFAGATLHFRARYTDVYQQEDEINV